MKQERKDKIKELFKKKKAEGKLTPELIFEVIDAVDKRARIETLEQLKSACDKKISNLEIE